MAKPQKPANLGRRGQKLWADLSTDDMPADQAALLVETCRTADRLDELDAMLKGEAVVRFMADVVDEYENVVDITISLDDALMEARQQANLFKQLLVTLRQLAPGAAKMPARTTRGTQAGGAKVAAAAAGVTDIGAARGGSWRGA